jgi:hypothetical protein
MLSKTLGGFEALPATTAFKRETFLRHRTDAFTTASGTVAFIAIHHHRSDPSSKF